MEIERNLKLVSTRRRRFSLSRYMGWLRYIASLPRVGRIVGVHYVTNSTSLDAKRSSLFKSIKMGTTTSIWPVICFVFFCIFNGISSKEEKRANKDTLTRTSLPNKRPAKQWLQITTLGNKEKGQNNWNYLFSCLVNKSLPIIPCSTPSSSEELRFKKIYMYL